MRRRLRANIEVGGVPAFWDDGLYAAADLPAWAERSRFDHFYRLALNTRADRAQADLPIHAGDALAEVLSNV